MAYEIKRFGFDGTIDADGHILEPPDLFQRYKKMVFWHELADSPAFRIVTEQASS